MRQVTCLVIARDIVTGMRYCRQWYSGIIISNETKNGVMLHTIKYDDDSVEKDVPAQLIRPSKAEKITSVKFWTELSTDVRQCWVSI